MSCECRFARGSARQSSPNTSVTSARNCASRAKSSVSGLVTAIAWRVVSETKFTYEDNRCRTVISGIIRPSTIIVPCFKNHITPGLAAVAALLQCFYQREPKTEVINPTTLFPMDGNDTLGDCTIADLAHATTVYNGLLGKENIMPKASVVALIKSLQAGRIQASTSSTC